MDVWWKRTVRVLQFNIEDPYGIEASVLKPEDLVAMAENLHANVLVVFARDPWGRAFYRTDIAPPHPKLNDFVEKLAALTKEKNIKLIVMVAHTANKILARRHSDWIQMNIHGEPVVLEHIPNGENVSLEKAEWPLLCLNSPFGDYVVEEVLDVVRRVNVDGVLLDSFRYQPDLPKACYCRWCRERFREEHGYDLPDKEDWCDSRWREAWLWRYRVVVRKICEMYKKLKSVNPNAILMYNNHPAGWAGRANKVVELARNCIDAVFAECSESDHQPPGFITEMARLTKALSGGKPVWISRNVFHMYRTPQTTSALTIRQGVREAIIGGASPWILVFSSTYAQDRRFLDAVAQVFKEVEKLEPYIEGSEPLKFMALVFSTTTNDFYGRNEPHRYVDEVRGFYYMAVHSHIPVDYLSELDINSNRLKEYKLVVLANTVCLDDRSASEIRRYVAEGGRILGTYLVSYMDSDGVERHDLELGDVFGVRLVEILRSDWSYVVLSDTLRNALNIDRLLVGDMSYVFDRTRVSAELGWQTIVEPLGNVDVYGWIGTASRYGYEYTLGRSAPPMIARTDRIAISLSRFGEGYSSYLTFQLGRLYWRTGLEEYRKLFIELIKLLRLELPIETDTPETVEIAMFRQKERLVIHMLNHSYNQRILARGIGRTRQGLPGFGSDEAVHPARTVIPVHNTVLRVRRQYLKDLGMDYTLVAYSPLSDREFDIRVHDDVVEVRIPRIDEYEVLVLEPRS